MLENSETWAWWMVLLAIVAILGIFGTALYSVNVIRDGSKNVRFRQQFLCWRKHHPDDGKAGQDQPPPSE